MKKYVLSDEWFTKFHTTGFIVIENCLSVSECDVLRSLFELHADQNFTSLISIERTVPDVRKFVRNSELVQMMKMLHNAEMCTLGSQVLFKQAGSPFASHAWNEHQDNSYIMAPYGTYISAIFALEDSDPENGGIYNFPESHFSPLLPYDHFPSFDPKMNPGHKIKKIPPQYKKRDLIVKKGSLYIQHGNLIHGSYSNRSQTRSRPHFNIAYMVKGVSFKQGNPQYPRIAENLD